jgi:hypothetical protein
VVLFSIWIQMRHCVDLAVETMRLAFQVRPNVLSLKRGSRPYEGVIMKVFVLCVLLGLAAGASAAEGKGCEALKAAIAAKLESKGVRNYTLEIVPVGEEREGRVVGQCEGGTRKIVYLRGSGK